MNLTAILETSKGLEVQGKYTDADKLLSGAILQLHNLTGTETAKLFNQRGIVRRMLERYDESFRDYESAFNTSFSDQEQRALACINKADIYRVARKDFKKAHESLDAALVLAEEESLTQAKALDQRGLVFVAEQKYDPAYSSYDAARQVCEKLLITEPKKKDVANRFAQIIHHIGSAYLLAKDPSKIDEAYESQITALNIFINLEDQQGIVNTISTIGNIAMIKADPDKALEQYMKALSILQHTKYQRGIAGLSLSIAEAHLSKKQPQKAEEYLINFCAGVVDGKITQHDIILIKDQFRRVYDDLHNQRGAMHIGIEGVRKKFFQ